MKPYYVFRRSDQNYYLGTDGLYTNDVKEARRFNTIHDLIVWVAKNDRNLFPCDRTTNYSIEKVETQVVTETKLVVTPVK